MKFEIWISLRDHLNDERNVAFQSDKSSAFTSFEAHTLNARWPIDRHTRITRGGETKMSEDLK